jgi:hypothetical protein
MTMDRKEPAIDKGDGRVNAESKISRPFEATTPQLEEK